MLCVVLVVSGGWIALASRQTAQPVVGSRPSIVGEDQDATTQARPTTDYRLPTTLLEGPSPGGGLGNSELFFRMMLSVGLIVGLGAAAFYLSKRVLPKVAHAPGKEIHVLETAYLGPRKTLHLVEVGGQRLLIASTSDCITMLAPIRETWSELSSQELGEAGKA